MSKYTKHEDSDNLLVLLLGLTVISMIVIFVVFSPIEVLNLGELANRKDSQDTYAAERKISKESKRNKDKREINVGEFVNKTDFGIDGVDEGKVHIKFDEVQNSYKIRIDATTIEEFRSLKPEAEQLITDAGVENLCSIKANYVIPFEIKHNVTWEDLFITGCAPLTS